VSRIIGPLTALQSKVTGGQAERREGSSKSVPADSEIERIQSHLDEFISGKRSFIRNLGLLAISVFAFIQLGLLSYSLPTILIIVAVVLVHELGHFIGMRAFGYRNVHIFFIPTLGAATSGIQTNPSGSQKAIVSLLGPFPGILIGIGLTCLYVATKNEMLIQPAWIFLLLNAFNLLPFFPLDGGRFVESLFSSKNVMLEIVFKIVSALGLALALFVFVGPIRFLLGFGGIFIMLIIMVASSLTFASAMNKVVARLPITNDLNLNYIPIEYLSSIYEVLKSKLLFSSSPKALASQIHYVWERLLNKPPSSKVRAAFLIFYLFSLSLALSAPIFFKSAVSNVRTEKSIGILNIPNGLDSSKSNPFKDLNSRGLK